MVDVSGVDVSGEDPAFAANYRRLAEYAGAGSGASGPNSSSGGEDPADPADVLAMQMVIHVEKAQPPTRADTLIAAARAAVLLCLDDRASGDGPWVEPLDMWCNVRIRKIARRARGAHWVAAQQVWGVTVEHGTGAARALVPGRVGDVDKRISRLQIGGTDLAGELPTTSEHPVTLWVNPGLEMTVGKLAAQVGHASMLAVRLLTVEQAWAWREAGCPLAVCAADDAKWEQLLAADAQGTAAAVRDAGFTEIAPGSVTVIAEYCPEAESWL